ncbi:MAG: hypothetical protein ACRD2L_10770, partial [Terriglobia bacterium]
MKDPATRSCSLEARGLWMDLLCLMWECPRRGYLKTGKEPWGVREISCALSIEPARTQTLLNELLSAGVCDQKRSDHTL